MRAAFLVLAAVLVLVLAPSFFGAPPFTASPDHPAIEYWTRPLTDPVAKLEGRKLRFDDAFGYLPAVLEALDIPVESQILTFAKTSIQAHHISPVTPRALYFNDTAVVGWIRGAPVLELASQDPRQGIIFRTIVQRPMEAARFERPTRCLSCHDTSLNVPGMLVRSVHTMPDGRAVFPLGITETDHSSPWSERWGGWFVSGPTPFRHLGNSVVVDIKDASARRAVRAPDDGLLAPGSDPVALMVFEHQVHGMNLLVRLGWECRVAGHMSADPLVAARQTIADTVAYLRFEREAPLPAPVEAGPFAAAFQRRGAAYKLDLRTRLFAARVSYLTGVPAFAALPDAVRAELIRLTGVQSSNQ